IGFGYYVNRFGSRVFLLESEIGRCSALVRPRTARPPRGWLLGRAERARRSRGKLRPDAAHQASYCPNGNRASL
ncbi:hypothetical protein M885DRAFT_552167, partial [Pelagophyceae sp. CCMP2097]